MGDSIGRVKLILAQSVKDLLRQKRRALFCDSSFLAEEPGSAFPRAWTSNFQLEQEVMKMSFMV